VNNILGEQVVVNQDIPKFLPKFQNPIYDRAMANREAIIESICNGNCKGTLGSLVNTIGGLQPYEIERILWFWLNRDFFELMDLYGDDLSYNDLVAIQNTDALLNKNLEETNGRN